MPIYRKIYEQHHGLIPKDEHGRTYDIHHIDGNRKNNDPSNLVALSIKDHYDIHFVQNDFLACQAILRRMDLTPEEISLKCSSLQKSLVENKNHHLLGGEIQRKYARQNNLKRIADGTHNFCDSKKQSELGKRAAQSSKHFLKAEKLRKAALRRVEDGTNAFSGSSMLMKLKEEGRHPSQKIHVCPHCGHEGKGGSMMRWHFDRCRSKES